LKKISFKYLQNTEQFGGGRVLVLYSFVGVRVNVALCWNKLALRRKPKNLHANSPTYYLL